MILNYFNIHIDDVSDKFTSNFMSVTESFNLTQHVTEPTHIKGHTLDLVFSFDLHISSILSEDLCISDDNCSLFDLPFNLNSTCGNWVINSCILINHLVEKIAAAFENTTIIMSHRNVDVQVQSFNEYCLEQLL